jgi:Tol biopolymer transport system component
MVGECVFFGLVRLVDAKMALLVASIAFLAMLTSCGTQPAGSGPTKPASSNHNGKIAFTGVDSREGRLEIFVVKADGTGVRRLATKPTQDGDPAWSSDGKRLAFQAVSPQSSNIDFPSDIYIMNADGSGIKRLTKVPTEARTPSWSPDGTKLAYIQFKKKARLGTRTGDIYTIRADGTDPRQLTDEGVDQYPAFSPDGKTIAFDRLTKGSEAIYTVNSDGNGLDKRTDPPKGFWDEGPCWSPEGTKIAFTRWHGDRPEVFMMNADGTHVRKLTAKTEGAHSPAFSPDGKKVVFVGEEGASDKLYVMDEDGTNARRLTKTQADIYEESPDWQPLP